ncbi:MAG: DUF1871 family protein [Clostridia bacterium]|nr:DUF1871 family protein [Clostridia bacterium]
MKKEEYERVIGIAKKVIDKWDPIGLLAMGAPADEYSFEISDIAAVALKVNDSETLAKSIQDIFIKYFGSGSFRNSFEECREIATKLKLAMK